MNMKFLHRVCRPILGLILLLGISSANAALYAIQSQDVDANGGNMCLAASRIISGDTIPLLRTCNSNDKMQQFDISDTGSGQISIDLMGTPACLMLSSSNISNAYAGDKIIFGECGFKNINRNLWKYQYSSLMTSKGEWCFTVNRGAGKTGATSTQLTIDKCTYSADRKWTIRGLPEVADGRPVSVVKDTTLSQSQIGTLVNWILAENSLDKTNFCWKKPGYLRPTAHDPQNCSGDKIGAICYDQCPSGMTRLSSVDPTCAGQCDPDFERTGVRTCFRPLATRAAHFESCKNGYSTAPLTCTKKSYPWNTYSRGHSCDDGFDWNGSSCTRVAATRPLATKEASFRQQTCNSGEYQDEFGLCNDYAKTGFTCTGISCTQQCASGTSSCGPNACAQNAGTCVTAEVDMIVSPVIMLASFATEGTAGAAANSVRTAVDTAKKAAAIGQDAAALALILRDSINNYMDAAEMDLAGISTAQIAEKMDATYKKGSPNYRSVVREYAVLQIMMAVNDMMLQLDMLAITSADITGVSGTVAAFAKPPCTQHTPIPVF